MPTHSWGGTVNSTAMNTSDPGVSIFSDPLAMPTPRFSADGQRPIQINSVALASLTNGVASIIYQGIEPALPWIWGGYAGSFQVRASRTGGTMFVGRNTGGGGSTYWSDGGSLSGVMPGSFNYSMVPDQVSTPSIVSGGTGSATLTWTAPDSGGSAITGFIVQASPSATFASGVVASERPAGTTSYTFTTLAPGVQYYFRVAARNEIASVAGTFGVWSPTVNTFISGGLFAGVSDDWVGVAAFAGVNGEWISCTPYAGVSGSWKSLA